MLCCSPLGQGTSSAERDVAERRCAAHRRVQPRRGSPCRRPRYGGIEPVVALLTEGLVAHGHDVTLFASGGSSTSAHLVATHAKAPSMQLGQTVPELEHVAACIGRAGNFERISGLTLRSTRGRSLGARGDTLLHTCTMRSISPSRRRVRCGARAAPSAPGWFLCRHSSDSRVRRTRGSPTCPTQSTSSAIPAGHTPTGSTSCGSAGSSRRAPIAQSKWRARRAPVLLPAK